MGKARNVNVRTMTTVVAVLAAALLGVGCGGVDLPVEEQSTYEVPVTSDRTALTCHEDCRFGCFERYPDDSYMQNLCTFSCIDNECGGGPFPLQQ